MFTNQPIISFQKCLYEVQCSISTLDTLLSPDPRKKNIWFYFAVWCQADSVQWVYQTLFAVNSCLLLLEIRLTRALRLDHGVNVL